MPSAVRTLSGLSYLIDAPELAPVTTAFLPVTENVMVQSFDKARKLMFVVLELRIMRCVGINKSSTREIIVAL
jgi:hypothetical protein